MKTNCETPTEYYGEVRDLSSDKTGRFGTDGELRRSGYKINSRPVVGPTLWEKAGKVVEEQVALLRLEKLVLQVKGDNKGGV